MNSLNSLTSLTELNLRRNKIQNVQGLDKLPALQRVFLSHNAIQSLQDVSCIFGIQYLIELSLDGNPVADADPTKYRQYIISTITTLKHLDLKRINDDERIAPFDSSLDIHKVVKTSDNFDRCEDEVELTIKAEGLGIECIDAGEYPKEP